LIAKMRSNFSGVEALEARYVPHPVVGF